MKQLELSPVTQKLSFLLPLLGIICVSWVLTWYSPDELLALIGVSNAYLLLFILATIGGISTFTGVPYHFILMSFAAGGMNPFLLGLVTASGVMLGDSTSYFVGHQGSEILPDYLKKPLGKISDYLLHHPKMVAPLLITYGTFSPFSNDFIVISMGLIRYSYWRVMLPLTLGNIFYNVGLAYLGYFAFENIQNFF